MIRGGGVTRETSAALVLEYMMSVGAEEAAELLDSKMADEPEHGARPLQALKAYAAQGRSAGDMDRDEPHSTLSHLVERALRPSGSSRGGASRSSTTLRPSHDGDRPGGEISGHAGTGEGGGMDTWSSVEISALRVAVRTFPASMGRKSRFAAVAAHVGTKSVRACFDKFTELRDAKAAKASSAPAASSFGNDEDAASSSQDGHAEMGVSAGRGHASSSTAASHAAAPSGRPVAAAGARQPAKPSIWDALVADDDDDPASQRALPVYSAPPGCHVTRKEQLAVLPPTAAASKGRVADVVEEDVEEEVAVSPAPRAERMVPGRGLQTEAGVFRSAPGTARQGGGGARGGAWGSPPAPAAPVMTSDSAPSRSAAVQGGGWGAPVAPPVQDRAGVANHPSDVPRAGPRSEFVIEDEEEGDDSAPSRLPAPTRLGAAPLRDGAFAGPQTSWGERAPAAALSRPAPNVQREQARSGELRGGLLNLDDLIEEDGFGGDAQAVPPPPPTRGPAAISAHSPAAAPPAGSASAGDYTSASALALKSLALDGSAIAAAASLATRLGARPPVPIAIEAAAGLRLLLYGEGRTTKPGSSVAVRSFNAEWWGQGIAFSDTPGLCYGLVQPRGGPCGALASLQAEVIRFLFYASHALFDGACAAEALADLGYGGGREPHLPLEPEESAVTALDVSHAQQQRAVVLAFTEIIWRCRPPGDEGGAVVAVVDEQSAATRERLGAGGRFGASTQLSVGETPVLYVPDGITERLRLWRCSTKAAVAAVVEAHLPVLARTTGPGIPLLVYSALLTRGVGDVVADMDTGMGGAATLIGAHNYATQVGSLSLALEL